MHHGTFDTLLYPEPTAQRGVAQGMWEVSEGRMTAAQDVLNVLEQKVGAWKYQIGGFRSKVSTHAMGCPDAAVCEGFTQPESVKWPVMAALAPNGLAIGR